MDYEAELSIDPVDGKWDTGRPVDEFMKENNGHIETTIYFEDGKEANEYTDAIEDIFDNIQSYPYPIVLRIKANDNYIFYWEYYDNKIPSRERILDEVERNI